MFSASLPPPKHTVLATLRVRLPKKAAASKALALPEQPAAIEPLSHGGALQYGQQAPETAPMVTASLDDTIPLKVKYPHLKHHFPRHTLRTCPDDSLARCVEQTKAVVDRLLGVVSDDSDPAAASFVNLKSGTIDAEHETLVEIRTYKEDPMLPPRFKLRKNREKPPPPPQPVLKATSTEKITKEMKDKWHIPSAVSNWKNNQGFAIALDKRVKAASGGTMNETAEINMEKFGQLSRALETADRTAREELNLRNEQKKKEALKEQAEKERKLETLLQKSKSLKNTSSRNTNYKRSGDYDSSSRKKQRGA